MPQLIHFAVVLQIVISHETSSIHLDYPQSQTQRNEEKIDDQLIQIRIGIELYSINQTKSNHYIYLKANAYQLLESGFPTAY